MSSRDNPVRDELLPVLLLWDASLGLARCRSNTGDMTVEDGAVLYPQLRARV